MATWQLNNKTLKAKLHCLPQSVVRSASHQPLLVQQQQLRDTASASSIYLIAFNLNPASTPRTSITSTIPRGLSRVFNPILCHRIPFSLLLDQMVSFLDLLFPRDLFGAQTKSTAPGPQQSAHGKNILEVSYQERSKDQITHTESSRFHFIEIHQGTVGELLTLLIVFGLLLCCMRFLRLQFLRRQQLLNLRELFLRGYQNPDREFGNAGHGGRNLPTAPGSGIWSHTLSELPLEFPNTISWQTDQSDVMYLGEFHTQTDTRSSQPAPISPKLEPSLSNSGTATKRRIRRGRARHLKSDRDIERIAETSINLNSMSSILQERVSGRRVQNLTTVKRLHYVAQSMSNLSEELKDLLAAFPK